MLKYLMSRSSLFSLVLLMTASVCFSQSTDTLQDQKISSSETDTIVFAIVEQAPEFIGGEAAMYQWLAENIKYPQDAKEKGITGTVIISFIIEKNGAIARVKIIKDIGSGCGEEASRAVKAMPNWNPGKQNGKPVRVQFILPVHFSL